MATGRLSLRAAARAFGAGGHTTSGQLGKKAESLPSLSDTLLSAQAGGVLELDELWSFVGSRANVRWVWIALCHQTRRIVA